MIIQSGNNVKRWKKMQTQYNTNNESLTRTGRDFELSYSVKSEKTMAHCIQQTDIDDPNNGSLCIFITPPATLNTTFGRAFFFY